MQSEWHLFYHSWSYILQGTGEFSCLSLIGPADAVALSDGICAIKSTREQVLSHIKYL